MLPPKPDPLCWNDSLNGDYLWTNTNFGEAVTEVMTPLAWSILRFTLNDWEYLPGMSTTGNIGGYPYLNISIFASIFKALRRSRKDLLDTMEGTLYMHLPDEVEIPLIQLTSRQVLSSLPGLMRIQLKQKQGIRQLPAYLETNPQWFQQMRQRIRNTASKAALLSLWHDEIKAHIKRGVWIVLGTATYSSDYTIPLRRELESLVGPEDASILIANVSGSEGLLPSLGPLVGLSRVASGEMGKDAYVQAYGHRGPHEFEISVPRPAEDPHWLDSQIARFHDQPVDIGELISRQREAYHAAWQRLSSRHPSRAESLKPRIAESARRVRMREAARSEYTRDRWLIRLFALRAGELAGVGNDIFFLTLNDVFELIRGDGDPSALIPHRRETYLEYKRLPPYPPIIRGAFEPFRWAADPNRPTDIYIPPSPQNVSREFKESPPKVLRGAAGSAGCVEGLVRRLDDPAEADDLLFGEILVTSRTDISWTPLFPRLGAVVTDVGAPLSHAAIVARELGIPAVVGCAGATARLKTGDRVIVDGSKGYVEII